MLNRHSLRHAVKIFARRRIFRNRSVGGRSGLIMRTASIQWDMQRPASAEAFFERAAFFVETAVADYAAHVVVFPEYFTLPLLSLGPRRRAMDSIRALATQTPEVTQVMADLARHHRVWIVAGSQPVVRDGTLFNIAFIHGPDGELHEQAKLHITPWERHAWDVRGGNELVVVDTGLVKFGVQICYDVEFPEPSRVLAERGIELLLVPYCTDDRRGHLRVSRCAMARAIENQIAVVTAGCIGTLTRVPAANLHYARSAAYTPVDLAFPPEGIAAEADPAVEQLLMAELDLAALRGSRGDGTVTPLKDRRRDLFR